jgi:hypothetical protein
MIGYESALEGAADLVFPQTKQKLADLKVSGPLDWRQQYRDCERKVDRYKRYQIRSTN